MSAVKILRRLLRGDACLDGRRFHPVQRHHHGRRVCMLCSALSTDGGVRFFYQVITHEYR